MSSSLCTEPPWSGEDQDRIPPEYTIVAEFPSVTWGWECDMYYWILRDPEGRFVIGATSHGRFYIGELSQLEDQINNLTDYIGATRKAIEMLTSPTS